MFWNSLNQIFSMSTWTLIFFSCFFSSLWIFSSNFDVLGDKSHNLNVLEFSESDQILHGTFCRGQAKNLQVFDSDKQVNSTHSPENLFSLHHSFPILEREHCTGRFWSMSDITLGSTGMTSFLFNSAAQPWIHNDQAGCDKTINTFILS